jgi:hypothetical protein
LPARKKKLRVNVFSDLQLEKASNVPTYRVFDFSPKWVWSEPLIEFRHQGQDTIEPLIDCVSGRSPSGIMQRSCSLPRPTELIVLIYAKRQVVAIAMLTLQWTGSEARGVSVGVLANFRDATFSGSFLNSSGVLALEFAPRHRIR